MGVGSFDLPEGKSQDPIHPGPYPLLRGEGHFDPKETMKLFPLGAKGGGGVS
jgi:hypothetical protein